MVTGVQRPLPPCVLYEDEHILVVHKPPGWNTHAPSPWAGQGLYDWLRDREPRWAGLAIVHRLDKETSGVMVFGKSALANRSLTEQFATHKVRKRYVFWTDRLPPRRMWTARDALVRSGPRRLTRPVRPGDTVAETRFAMRGKARDVQARSGPVGACTGTVRIWEGEAQPVTGKTHQIRAQAAAAGVPVLGDTLYGGTPWPRLCLHAEELGFHHPASGEFVTFRVPPDFLSAPCVLLRRAMIEPDLTDAYRWVHGAADGWPGWYVDRFGSCLLSQAEGELSEIQRAWLLQQAPDAVVYHKILRRNLGGWSPEHAAPRCIQGPPLAGALLIRENGLRFEVRPGEGYSVGLFLDQRDNRRRLLHGYVTRGFLLGQGQDGTAASLGRVLNTFAYTCGFSVAAACAGAQVTSVDLSRRYLDWGRRNFLHNGLDPDRHEFVAGDVRNWLRRWQRQGRRFDLILIDPPTFSRSKDSGVFRVESDLASLVNVAAGLLSAEGVLFVSSNAVGWPAPKFVAAVVEAVQAAGRRMLQQHYVPQPPDFPVHAAEPGYLKTLWCRLD